MSTRVTVPKAHLGGQNPLSAFSLVLTGAGSPVTTWVLICAPVLGTADDQTLVSQWRAGGSGEEGRAGAEITSQLPVAAVESQCVVV